MYNLKNGITKHGVNTKIGSVPHRNKLPIPTPHSILCVVDFLNDGCLITLPVAEDSREQKILLVEKNVLVL